MADLYARASVANSEAERMADVSLPALKLRVSEGAEYI